MKRYPTPRYLLVLATALGVLFASAALPSASANGLPPQLSMTFSPETIYVGQETMLIFELTNPSDLEATNIALSMDIPPGFEPIDFDIGTCPGDYSLTTANLSGFIFSLEGYGGTCSFNIEGTASAPGVYELTIDTFTYNSGETASGDTATLTVVASPEYTHDACYATGGSESDRSRCDASYRSDLRAQCAVLYPDDAAARLACYREANNLYQDARRNGRSEFNYQQSAPSRPLPGSRRR